MSREKQIIKEIAKDLCQNTMCSLDEWNTCSLFEGVYCVRCLDLAERLYNAGYRKQEWISVDERLPETRETILYFNGEWVDACYFDGDDFMTLDTYESDIIDGVTHWMPLPQPPKENKND